MRLAFYTPMKRADDPVASGDRTMARALLAALGEIGAQVDQPCELRSRDGKGDSAVQAALIAQADALLPDLIARGRRADWRAWLTYHSYYKAPDLVGPAVARALGIPYLLVEATRARKRLGGPWDAFAQRAEAACEAAGVIFYLTEQDHEALAAYAPRKQQLIHLHPFLQRSALPPAAQGSGLLSVGMMRFRAKLASYTLIAETIALLPDDRTLRIAGDGPARAQVEAMMRPFAERVTFLGKLGPEALAREYQTAGAFIWPGVEEAFGLVYLEAQAHGLPVIAQDRPGVRDVLFPRKYPNEEAGAKGLAALALTPPPRAQDIRAHIAAHHLLPAAAATLGAGLALARAA